MAQQDLLVMQVPAEANVRHRATLTFGEVSKATTGIQKLTQWVMCILLTRIGSSSQDPEYGTNLLEDLRGRNTIDDEIVQQAFGRASQRVLAAAEQYAAEYGQKPDDETLTDLTLLNWSPIQDGAMLRIRVRSAAGDTLEYQVPTTEFQG